MNNGDELEKPTPLESDLGADLPPELKGVARVWNDLPEAIRAAIPAMVRSTGSGEFGGDSRLFRRPSRCDWPTATGSLISRRLRAAIGLPCSTFADVSPLAKLKRLRVLEMLGCRGVSRISPLTGLTELRRLDLTACGGVRDFSALAGLPNLTSLGLPPQASTEDLWMLRERGTLANLTELNLVGCAGVTDLSPLAKLPNLRSLNLSYCGGLTNLDELAGLTSLEELRVEGTTRRLKDAAFELHKLLPRCRVSGDHWRTRPGLSRLSLRESGAETAYFKRFGG